MLKTRLPLLLTFVASMLAGCGEPSPLRIHLNNDVIRPPRSVVVFFPDGLDRSRFNEMLAAGQLPNIARRFVQGGVRVEGAVDSLPSITHVNCTSMVTGLFPGRHGLLGNSWFDRRTLESHSYLTMDTFRTINEHFTAPTLYNILADRFTFNLQLQTSRGVTRSIDGADVLLWNWIWGTYLAADRSVPERLREVAAIANAEKRWPSVIMTYFPAVDEIGHHWGPSSAEYGEALKQLDIAVGRMTEAIDQAGLGDRTYYVLVTDHGMPAVAPDHHLAFNSWLREQRALNCRESTLEGKDYAAHLAMLNKYDAFLVVGADRMAAIHLRGRQGWSTTPAPDEAASFVEAQPRLAELPAVDCILTREGPDRVRLWSSRGAAVLERTREGDQARYRLHVGTGDPLG